MPSQPTADAAAKPRGRAATVAAIVASARALYRERSPAEVTMQEIADHANVNRGLVHHYFGSKEDLFTAIFEVTSEQAAQEVRATGDLLASLTKLRARRDGYAHMLGWSLISGMDAADFVSRSPTITALVEQAATFTPDPATTDPAIDPRMVVAAAITLSLGWQIFEPFMLRAAGIDDLDAEERIDQLGRLIDTMVTAALDR